MNIIIDACSLINLHHAGALRTALMLPTCRFWITVGVLAECNQECGDEIRSALDAGLVSVFSDEDVSAEILLHLLSSRNLGQGETESIAACASRGFYFCSDDAKARKLAATELTSKFVLGSLRVLRWCVEAKLIECLVAFAGYGAMMQRGAFLPDTKREFFCAEVEDC